MRIFNLVILGMLLLNFGVVAQAAEGQEGETINTGNEDIEFWVYE